MDKKKKENSEICKEVLLACTTAATIAFGVGTCSKQERIEDIEAENEHYKEFCKQQFQENVGSVKENVPQNEDGDYVFEVGGLHCSVSAQSLSPLPCWEHFQENVESVKENALQNEDGDYVFEVDGLYCSVPAQLPSPSQD